MENKIISQSTSTTEKVKTQGLMAHLPFLLVLFFEAHAFEELDQDFPQPVK